MEYMHPMASLTVRLVRSIYEHLRPAIVLFATLCMLIISQSSAQAALVLTVGPTTGPIPAQHYTNLQTALIAAGPGDTLLLEAGVTFTGSYWLPSKPEYGAYTEWITITTSAFNSLPPQGHRITPAYASVLPKIVSPGSNLPAIYTESDFETGRDLRAHHYRLIGVEIMVPTSVASLNDLILLGTDAETDINNVSHHLIFDRCYIHGNQSSGLKRGIALNSAQTDIINSYISDCHLVGTDSQAIGGWNGPGPFKIINNYLEGAAENVLFGGATAHIIGLVPSDIEIRHNYFYKPLSWLTYHADPNDPNARWRVKNLLEFKSAQRVVVDNNLFENNWGGNFPGGGQPGFAILFTPGLDSGPSAVVQDIDFTNNVVRHSANGINIKGKDAVGGNEAFARRIRIYNNLVDDISGPAWGGDNGIFVQVLGPAESITVDHNTSFQIGSIVVTDYDQSPGFVFTNNTAAHNVYGIVGGGVLPGTQTFNAFFYGNTTVSDPRHYIYRRNVIASNCVADNLPGCTAGSPPTNYPTNASPTDNFYPQGRLRDTAGFVDFAGGNYRLAPTSAYRIQATDGRDVGCNIDALNVALRTSDFDGDRKTETAVWRPSNGTWYVLGSNDGSERTYPFGTTGDIPAPGDYDGDGQTDYAVFRPGTGAWYILKSSNSISTTSVFFGTNGDQPVPGDYDADGKTDVAVFRSSNNTWYVLKSSNGALLSGVWGQSADRVVPADYDGDGKTDFAVFRPSTTTWYILNSFDSTTRAVQWGLSTDRLVPGDYNGDGRIDIAVWRPSTVTYHIMYSLPATTTLSYQWGASGDLPVIGDFDSDGMTDLCVWRPSNGTWYILQSSTGTLNSKAWGASGDVPVASAYFP